MRRNVNRAILLVLVVLALWATRSIFAAVPLLSWDDI